ncbi:MAG: 5'-deoxyadenosine deaminase [Candidatus Muiribacteriota bacterium]
MKLFKGGTVLTFTRKGELIKKKADVLISKNKIIKVESNIKVKKSDLVETINIKNKFIIPGFIQPHIHLCQVLFKGAADDMDLMDWLKKRIWPLEAMHTEETIDISAKMGICELMRGGTTTIVDMGTINHTDKIALNLIKSGMRAFFGKTMMDSPDLPDYIRENTKDSIKKSLELYEEFHNSGNKRVKYAFAPRFVVSCTVDLMKQTDEICKSRGLLYHTHASENKKEVEIVKKKTGLKNIEFFKEYNIADKNLLLAHCIWVDDDEIEIMKEKNIKVLHCPDANLKLASGISPVPEYLKRQITVGIAADGAPCNNNLSMFKEMRQAALIQKPIHGPTIMPAQEVFKMATVGGAETVGLKDEIGTIEEGKKADIVVVDLNKFNSSPYFDPVSSLVYSASSENVDQVMIDGSMVYDKGEFLTINTDGLISKANQNLFDMMKKL